MLQSECDLCPKTLIYCKSIKDCGHLFTFFKNHLGTLAYANGAEQISKNMLIGMYHHNTIEKNKKIVTSSLYNPNGKCRVIFCTNALGMGINFPDIRYVVHYGPPRNVEDFLQEIGRSGRDGKSAMAILLFRGKHLRKCDTAIKNYANGDNVECLRTHILSEFRQIKHDAVGHDCCLLWK
jgi:ATP-dependent DNA helicase RecQ